MIAKQPVIDPTTEEAVIGVGEEIPAEFLVEWGIAPFPITNNNTGEVIVLAGEEIPALSHSSVFALVIEGAITNEECLVLEGKACADTGPSPLERLWALDL